MQVWKTKSVEGLCFLKQTHPFFEWFQIRWFWKHNLFLKQSVTPLLFESNVTSFENDLKSFLILKGKAFVIKLCFQKTIFQNNTLETRFWILIFIFANKIFLQGFCLINQLQTFFYGKVYFWKGFGFQGKIKVFKTNLSQKIFGLKTQFIFEIKRCSPFYLNQTKLVLKMIWNHFSFWKVKLS